MSSNEKPTKSLRDYLPKPLTIAQLQAQIVYLEHAPDMDGFNQMRKAELKAQLHARLISELGDSV